MFARRSLFLIGGFTAAALLTTPALAQRGGGGLDSCPGTVCTNCAASGDCNITCAAGEFEFCGAFGFFEDPGLRCAFCDSRQDPFASRVPTGP